MRVPTILSNALDMCSRVTTSSGVNVAFEESNFMVHHTWTLNSGSDELAELMMTCMSCPVCGFGMVLIGSFI